MKMAQKISDKHRTADIEQQGGSQVDFQGLLLSPNVLKGLKKAGFVRPSPIQLRAIPVGRCGFDLIVQAKSGTGKTVVFAVIALENINTQCKNTQVLVLAPTREIVVQITEVVSLIGESISNLRCHSFIGGLSVAEDTKKAKHCHIAVGTPGRIKQLIRDGLLNKSAVRLFVLDEADKLLDESFQNDINWIYNKLPESKQMLALSATYPEVLAQLLVKYMQSPQLVRLDADNPVLLGVKQFFAVTSFHPSPSKTFENKISRLIDVLKSVPFGQCLIFSNYQMMAQGLCDKLNAKRWSAEYICGAQEQPQRLKIMSQFKQFKFRVLVSTDLTARGIDAENVDLVINLDVPLDLETYLHRIGRAGRFGSYGYAITLAASGNEQNLLHKIQLEGRLQIAELPEILTKESLNQAELIGIAQSNNFARMNPLQPRTDKTDLQEHKKTAGTLSYINVPDSTTESTKTKMLARLTKTTTSEKNLLPTVDGPDLESSPFGAAQMDALRLEYNIRLEEEGIRRKHGRRKKTVSSCEGRRPDMDESSLLEAVRKIVHSPSLQNCSEDIPGPVEDEDIAKDLEEFLEDVEKSGRCTICSPSTTLERDAPCKTRTSMSAKSIIPSLKRFLSLKHAEFVEKLKSVCGSEADGEQLAAEFLRLKCSGRSSDVEQVGQGLLEDSKEMRNGYSCPAEQVPYKTIHDLDVDEGAYVNEANEDGQEEEKEEEDQVCFAWSEESSEEYSEEETVINTSINSEPNYQDDKANAFWEDSPEWQEWYQKVLVTKYYTWYTQYLACMRN